MGRWWLLAMVAGCGGDAQDSVVGGSTLTWMEGGGYGWELFNHRLSHLELRVGDDDAEVSVVGGTSTTGVVRELAAGCDVESCDEFPFYDNFVYGVDWARATAPVAVGAGTAELLVGAAGGTVSLEVALDGPVGANAVAVIRGLAFDTNQPLEGEPDCYHPANGWLPRRIAVSVGEPAVSGSTATVEVTAAFEGGATLEAERACLDAVRDRAIVRYVVDVLVVSTDEAVGEHAVTQGATYAFSGDTFNPEAQDPPAGVALPVDAANTLVAFSALDYTFHVDDPEDRGAYLRTLTWSASPDAATGEATNFSPGTQLSGFDFQFDGTVRSAGLGAPVSRGRLEGTLPVALDEALEPVVTTLPLE